ncbi:MAG: mechanosensitive ion channel [Planctomycetota bacterium]|jgi:miniconductance mechanosensitive channel|nr:mechanosensitive ion channel [Planctomycetota bacterium]
MFDFQLILKIAAEIAILLALAAVANFIVKKIMLRIIKKIAVGSKTTWDNDLIENRVFDRLSHIAPVLVIFSFASTIIKSSPESVVVLTRLAYAYIAIVVALTIDGLLNFAVVRARATSALRDKPVNSWAQVVKIIVWLFTAIVVIAALLDKSPWALLGGLGALTAVLMLVFKDSIMGLVASIQISALNLVRIGDWVEIPKYGADGDVIEISLNTIRIQNWDKTISSVPPYALISDGFKNWRGMSESKGRRIKRSLRIDLNSISFLSPEDFDSLTKVQALAPYLSDKKAEIQQWNSDNNINPDNSANGRQLTNIGTFRAYLETWLADNPNINKDMTFLVRQLASDEFGLPIEIYIFSSEQRWAQYESILADIFDHVFAVLPEFNLRAYQRPAGSDFNSHRAV